jgi:diguanylate cyclase (GGDEF)-like protein
MSGADFILGINLLVAGLFAAAFMAIARYESQRPPALRLACAYGVGMAYLAIEFAIPAFRDAGAPVTIAFAVFLVATMAFNAALAVKYEVRLPSWPLLVFLVVTSGAVWLTQDMPRQSLARMMAYQLPYAVMQAVGLGIVWRSRQRHDRLDRLLMAALAASSLHFLAKPFIAHALGGWGANPQSYLTSPYAMVSQSLGTVLAIALALLMLVILVRDVLAEATSRSETDSLSGLLNRGGFQRQAELVVRDAARRHLPLALVIADLDHFKAINDGFGHACGDRVIEAFARLLREAAGGNHVAGRIGGEEFAILLPGSNLAGARLFAEGTRSAFGALPVESLPTDHRCSASFGVTELLPQDGVADLMQRADRALYQAKKGGRDQVRVATEPSDGTPRMAGFNGKG